MSEKTSGEEPAEAIEDRLARLEAENAALRAVVANGPVAAAPAPKKPSRHRGRAALATAMIVVAALLAPTALVTSWTAAEVSSTDRFVGTLGPLIDEPEVQAFVTDTVTEQIVVAVDPDALVDSLFDAILEDGATGPIADNVDLLVPLLADQMQTGIHAAVGQIVATDAFATVWEESLRTAHASAVIVLEGGDDGVIAIDGDGLMTLEIGPIVDLIRPRLVDAGFAFADAIPEINASIPLAEVPGVATARLAYQSLVLAGWVIPLLTLALLVGGILLHPRRPDAMVTAGVWTFITVGLLAAGLPIGRTVAVQVLADWIPPATSNVLIGGLLQLLQSTAVAFVLVAIGLWVAGAVAQPGPGAARFRGTVSGWVDRLAEAVAKLGVPAAAFAGVRKASQWIWLGLLALVVLGLLTTRPLTVTSLLVTALVTGVLSLAIGTLASIRGEEAALAIEEADAEAAGEPEPSEEAAPS